ncbi:MAG: TIGR02099 family protein, partial [Gammaproteobacteria bacterium]|nr:TIGR02099 family protein [Gammaproteobacteria bacterium]
LLPGYIGLRGADVQVGRTASGEFTFNGVPVRELLGESRDRPLPRLDLDLQEVVLRLVDPSRLVPRARLEVRQLRVGLAPDVVSFRGTFEGADGLGQSLEASGRLPVRRLRAALDEDSTRSPAGVPDDEPWAFRLAGSEMDFARWLTLILNEAVPLESGSGTVELAAELAGGQVRRLELDLTILNPRLAGLGEAEDNYQRLALRGRGSQSGDGFEAVLDSLVVERAGSPRSAASGTLRYSGRGSGAPALSADARRLSLDHLWPLARLLVLPALGGQRLSGQVRLPETLEAPALLQGEVTDLQFRATLPDEQAATYAARATFRGLGVGMPAGGWGLGGLTGALEADEKGGRLVLKFQDGLVRFPALFRADIRTRATEGQLAWRLSSGAVELFTDDLRMATDDAEGRARLRLTLPASGPPFIDLAARFTAASAPAALQYVPLNKLGPKVAKWLDSAIIAGRVPRADLLWQGPLKGIPYPDGGGQFRLGLTVEDVVLAYAPDWPRLESAAGTVVIDGPTLASTENRGEIAGLPFRDAGIRVPNLLRDARLEIAASDRVQVGQILGFLRASPIARSLDPQLQTVTGSGNVASTISLEIPVSSPGEFRLRGSFGLAGNTLGLKGVAFGLDDLRGSLRLDNTVLVADGVRGRFLDEPVEIGLRAATPAETGLTQVAEITGITPADKLVAAFSLPYGHHLSGDMAWQAAVQVPARRGGRRLQIDIRSDLETLGSTLPPPLTKPVGRPEPLAMAVVWPGPGLLHVVGRLERGVSWALEFDAPGSRGARGWRLGRGALRSGSRLASVPAESGLAIGGSFDRLRLEDWLPGDDPAGPDGSGTERSLLHDIDMEVGTFSAVGRLFRDVGIEARRDGESWRVAVRGPELAGSLTVPVGSNPGVPLVMDLERLYAHRSDPGKGSTSSDPRNLPPMQVRIADFSLGELQLGQLTAELSQRGDGVVLDPLRMDGDGFSIRGDGLWVVEDANVARQRSELRLQLDASNIASTLTALGYDPVVEGDKAAVSASLIWAGGPREDFLAVAAGRVTVDLAKGRFLPVEPGGGRILGLLSIAALPRRLGLDFSDVINQGLAFDEVRGEFRLEDGNAFTCNFGLTGPVTDMAIVGRTSLRDRSYDQLAVARPHVSDVLAVGGFMGGPLVGGTVLLMSQIFRKPLSTFGETYYRISGGWDRPQVEKVQRSEIDVTPFRDCERYLAEVLQQLPPRD